MRYQHKTEDKEQVTTWLKDPVTIDFLYYLKALRVSYDENTHEHLENNQPYEAAIANARMTQIDDIRGIPAQMKEDIGYDKEMDEAEGG